MSSLSSLEQENQQLRQELAEKHAQLGHQDKYERALLSNATTDQPQPAQKRYMANTQRHNRSRNQTLMHFLFYSIVTKITDTGRRCRLISMRTPLVTKERSRGSSNSCRPCPRPPESSPAARPKTAGLNQQHPPAPPTHQEAEDSPGKTQCQT